MYCIDYWHRATSTTRAERRLPPVPRADPQHIEFGLDSPAFVTVDASGQPLDGDVVIRNTIEEAVFADSIGIDSFNIGEHYRPDLMDSAGHVMLAAIASRTNRTD